MVSESMMFIVSISIFVLIVASLATYSSSKPPSNATGTVPPHGGTNATITIVNASAELNNSLNEGFAFNYSVFAANPSSDCELARISQCWNNAPSQAVCINSAYKASYQRQFGSISNRTGSVVCAMYYVIGNMSCTVMDGSCVLVYDTGQQ
ncbi:MAG: hypothetical protein KGH69_01525 [Candidatus Micrarchaeota archaeon]|nr:hypothetical protein [Candidatus Micrarchaeota archaeon]